MAIHAKLMKKLQRALKAVKDSTRGKQRKMDLREEVMAGSPSVLAVIRGFQRRMDAKLSVDVIPIKQAIEVAATASSYNRFAFAGGNAARMVFPAGLVQAMGLAVGDQVEVLSGQRKGTTIQVVEIGQKASGTITVIDNGFDSGEIVTVGGIALEEGVDWAAGGSTSLSAVALADAINSNVASVTATVLGAVITITAKAAGTAGNSIGMVEDDETADNFTMSAATLEGGISTDTVRFADDATKSSETSVKVNVKLSSAV